MSLDRDDKSEAISDDLQPDVVGIILEDILYLTCAYEHCAFPLYLRCILTKGCVDS